MQSLIMAAKDVGDTYGWTVLCDGTLCLVLHCSAQKPAQELAYIQLRASKWRFILETHTCAQCGRIAYSSRELVCETTRASCRADGAKAIEDYGAYSALR